MKDLIFNAAGRLWNRLDFPALGNLRFNILSGIYHIFPLIGGINYPRLIEWQFVLKHLPPPPAKIIDVGSTTSLFPFKLHAMGYDIHCLDQRMPTFQLLKLIDFHQDNLMSLSIKSNTFEAVSCISVIEHIGLGRYNDPLCYNDGDFKALKEMLRILKPNGRLIITTNLCRETCIFNGEIRYGKDRFDKLKSLGKVIEIEYRYFNGRRWIACSEEKVFSRDPEHFDIALLVLTKAE